MLIILLVTMGALFKVNFVTAANDFVPCKEYAVDHYAKSIIDESARCRSDGTVQFRAPITIMRDVKILGGYFGEGIQVQVGSHLGAEIEVNSGVTFGQYVCVENRNRFGENVHIPDQAMVRKTMRTNDEFLSTDYEIISIPKFRYTLGRNGECSRAEPIQTEMPKYFDCPFNFSSANGVRGSAKCGKYGEPIQVAGRMEINGNLYLDSGAIFNINMDGNLSFGISQLLINEQTTVILGENAHVGVLCKFIGVVAFGDNSLVGNRSTFINANVGPDVTIEDDCVVGGTIQQHGTMRKGAKLMENAVMEIGSILGQGSILGSHSVLRPRQVISRDSCIGNNVVVKISLGPKTMINADGKSQEITMGMRATINEAGNCVMEPLG